MASSRRSDAHGRVVQALALPVNLAFWIAHSSIGMKMFQAQTSRGRRWSALDFRYTRESPLGNGPAFDGRDGLTSHREPQPALVSARSTDR
jgi:hypothetical protein